MGTQAKNIIILGILAVLVVPPATSVQNRFRRGLETFSNKMLHQLWQTNGEDNIIYSPLSIHTCMTMVQMGAGGETASEMYRTLGLNRQTPESVVSSYHSLLSTYKSSSILHMANKIYVKKGYELNANYSELLETKFLGDIDTIDFGKATQASSLINTWVENETDHMIKNVVSPSMFDDHTRLMLLSVIHFNGIWKHPFEKESTKKKNFYNDETNFVQVDMMHKSFSGSSIKYGSIDGGHFVKMPYKDSDLSMMVFTTYNRTGLSKMLDVLSEKSLKNIQSSMRKISVDVELPKFNVEFEIDLTEPLQKLGMVRLFANADLGKMLKSPERLSVSKVVHKAVIEVDEKGTKASASTGYFAMDYSMPIQFIVDHPFYYAIVNKDNVILFQGTVVKF